MNIDARALYLALSTESSRLHGRGIALIKSGDTEVGMSNITASTVLGSLSLAIAGAIANAPSTPPQRQKSIWERMWGL